MYVVSEKVDSDVTALQCFVIHEVSRFLTRLKESSKRFSGGFSHNIFLDIFGCGSTAAGLLMAQFDQGTQLWLPSRRSQLHHTHAGLRQHPHKNWLCGAFGAAGESVPLAAK